MLTHEGEARDERADIRLAGSLAAVAGALNAAGFYAADVYSSNMTGNVSAVAAHLALAELGPAAVYLGLVLTFVLGAATSAIAISAGRRRGVGRTYAWSVLAEALLLAALAGVSLLLADRARDVVLAFGLAFLMGLQNALVTRISNARVRTTHVTGMVTDIGIELGTLAEAAWRRTDAAKEAVNTDKLRLHALTVACFCAGGLLGVVAFRALGPAFLFVAVAVLLALALPAILADVP